MNEENNTFSVDIQAEAKAISSGIIIDDNTPSEIINVVKDIPLPERISYTPSEVKIETDIKAQIASVSNLGMQTKTDIDDVVMKTAMLNQKITEVKDGFSEMYSEMKGGDWLANRNKDEFEERPLIDPKNLLFEFRRDNSSKFPPYA